MLLNKLSVLRSRFSSFHLTKILSTFCNFELDQQQLKLYFILKHVLGKQLELQLTLVQSENADVKMEYYTNKRKNEHYIFLLCLRQATLSCSVYIVDLFSSRQQLETIQHSAVRSAKRKHTFKFPLVFS